MTNQRWLLAILTAFSLYYLWSNRSVTQPAGILIKEIPIQINYKKLEPRRHILNADLEFVADFNIKARVLSTERYWIGESAKLVPVDVALGWLEMSNSDVINKLDISQSGRFYFYHWSDQPPLDPDLIMIRSVNMHLIPATSYLDSKIKKLRRGQLIHLKGKLTNVYFSDGGTLKTSTIREDTGAGACEIIYVTDLEII